MNCRVCELPQLSPPWGESGDVPSYDICDCCGVEFGYEDITPEAARRFRERWIEAGLRWFAPDRRPSDWSWAYSADGFEFTTVAPERADVSLGESTLGKAQLLEQIASGLSFPGYFGHNWDALIDCLSDLDWSRASEALIDHSGIPQLPVIDLRAYLDSLVFAANRRTPERRPRLRILFRLKDREAIAAFRNRRASEAMNLAASDPLLRFWSPQA